MYYEYLSYRFLCMRVLLSETLPSPSDINTSIPTSRTHTQLQSKYNYKYRCEANFNADNSELLGFRVAEYHNTYTNGAYCLASLLLCWIWFTKRTKVKSGHRILINYCLCLFLTGVTSGLFHATLRWGWQKMDEIFENLTVLTLFHATFVDAKKKDSERIVQLQVS